MWEGRVLRGAVTPLPQQLPSLSLLLALFTLAFLSRLSLPLCLFPSCSKQVGIEEMTGIGGYGVGGPEDDVRRHLSGTAWAWMWAWFCPDQLCDLGGVQYPPSHQVTPYAKGADHRDRPAVVGSTSHAFYSPARGDLGRGDWTDPQAVGSGEGPLSFFCVHESSCVR